MIKQEMEGMTSKEETDELIQTEAEDKNVEEAEQEMEETDSTEELHSVEAQSLEQEEQESEAMMEGKHSMEEMYSEEGSQSEADGKPSLEKRNLFKKREKKNKQDEQIADLTDRLKRQMAEFDNFRKRTEKEKAQMYEIGAKSVIEKILPVVDNFERALSTDTGSAGQNAFMEGMDKIYKQLMTELSSIGVKHIEAVGTEFNPDFHNAVMQVASEEFESGTVAQELQKGYLYRDTVVRHSMVAVVE